MALQDGTYLYQNGTYHPIKMTDGYWVAERELRQEEVVSGTVIGIWRDKETGKTYQDKVRLVRNLTKATMYATLWNQIAIWDNANQEEVRIG
jgi:hypothetical protein